MQGSKIRLSPSEMELFSNAQVILTKNSIIQKTIALLGQVQLEIENVKPLLYAASPSPKISKGENYLGLPFVILDYPRISQSDSLLFIRSMFWWGNFFSSTLQLSGEHKAQHQDAITSAYETLADRNYYIGINPDPWIHHSGEDNYQNISQLSRAAFYAFIENTPHIKIAAFWPLSEWDSAANKLTESWRFLTGLIT